MNEVADSAEKAAENGRAAELFFLIMCSLTCYKDMIECALQHKNLKVING